MTCGEDPLFPFICEGDSRRSFEIILISLFFIASGYTFFPLKNGHDSCELLGLLI
uniref:Uncharacterized protein n=1 Tax=Lepeophtheirus salmonis TaxID=72036 RepID=A0A0K2V111_LEPSM